MSEAPKKFRTRTADRALAGMFGPVTCVIQLEMVFDYELDEQRLAKAVLLLTDKEPILGCRFVPNRMRPYWERVEIERFNLFNFTLDQYEYEAYKNERMEFFNGPQIETCLYRSQSKDSLLLKVSHLVCDAAGVKDISGRLSIIYNQLADDPDFKPEPNLDDHRGFWQIVKNIPWYAFPRIVFNYLCEIYTSNIPGQSHVVPVEKASNNNVRLYTRHINKEDFAYMKEYARNHYATINDILLTAVIRALSRTGKLTPNKALRLGMAVDLRRYMPGKKAKSIANFSSLELLTYGTVIEKEFESTLTRMVEMVNKRKSSWLGLSSFVSTYLGLWSLPFFFLKIAGKKGWELKSNSSNSFDWLTNMGDIPTENVNFGGEPSEAWLLVPGCVLPMLFFGCSGYNGTLTLSWSVVPDDMNEKVIDTFFDIVFSELPVSAVRETEA